MTPHQRGADALLARVSAPECDELVTNSEYLILATFVHARVYREQPGAAVTNT
jgi:hypothetical protein